MSAVVAERELTSTTGETGFVRLHEPVLDGNAYGCEVQFEWAGSDLRKTIYGEDSYQALLLAMQIVPVFLSQSRPFKSGDMKVFDMVLRDTDRDDPRRTNLEALFGVKFLVGNVQ